MNKFLMTLLMLGLGACATASSQTLDVNGVTLNYSVIGDGPPLYLLHGGMESRDSFKKQIPEFAKSFTVVALDSREQGRSGRAEEQISYALMSKDVIALANHLGHDSISVMGLSDGGVTALTIAMNKPEIIDKLILLGANFHYSSYPDEMRNFIASYEWDGNTDPKAYPGNFIQHYMTGNKNLANFGHLLKEMSIMWTNSPTYTVDDLRLIEAETLIINGDHEDIALDHVLKLYDALPNAQLFIVPGGTHYSTLEQPELINSVVLDFLQPG